MNNALCAGPNSERIREILLARVALAESLHNHQRATFYDEGILLCSVLIACAAQRWPGEDVDRKRFVELLVRHSRDEMMCSWVSLPMLIRRGVIEETMPALSLPSKDNVWRDVDVDHPIATVLESRADLSPIEAKRCSYANLIYDWHAGGYPTISAALSPITCVPTGRKRSRVSYFKQDPPSKSDWFVGLSITYLYELAKHHAAIVVEHAEARPLKWWLDQQDG